LRLAVRVITVLAVIGGLVLGGVGVAAHLSASDDQDEVDALAAERADLEDAAEASATARARLTRRLDRRLQHIYRLEQRVDDVGDPVSELYDDDQRVLGALNRAIDRQNAYDNAEAERIAVEILLPLLDEERADLREELAAQPGVRAALRALRETER
jgi:hypothetical protein